MTTHRFVIEVEVDDTHQDADDGEWWADAATGALNEYGATSALWRLGPCCDDAAVLDRLNLLLSAEEWPGASGMEDVDELVRSTGRQRVPDAPDWSRH